MTSSQNSIQQFTQFAGERRVLNVNFSPSLASGDHLIGSPSVSVRQITGSAAAAISQLAIEPGATPSQVSMLIDTPAARCEYRLNVSCGSYNGERIIIPAIVRVLA